MWTTPLRAINNVNVCGCRSVHLFFPDVCSPLHAACSPGGPMCSEVHCSNVDVRESRDLLLNYHPGVLSALKCTMTRVKEEKDRRAQQSKMKQSNACFFTCCHNPDHHYVGRSALDWNILIRRCSIYLHDALYGNG